MRKFFKSLTNISLLQQLGTIIVIFGAFFVIFFTVYLRGNVNDFVTNQCLSIIQRSQDTVITNIQSGRPGYSELTYDMDVMHFVFEGNKLQSYYGASVYSEDMLEQITEMVVQHGQGWMESQVNINDVMFYYRLTTVDKKTKVMSMLSESYGNNIETALLSSVANNMAIVFFVMFVLLIIWVSTIITPLQQIKGYVEKVQKGDESAELSIERKDEIGELSKALVDMNNEIKQQEQTKEEMIHNISHDLKTPIAIIKSYAESIKDGIYPYNTLDASVDVIIENSERLEKKVQSLLFLNRLDYVMDQERDTDKTTDMVILVKSVCMNLKMIRPEVTVEKYLEKGVRFKGDEESWRVVVSNLMDNALRYAEGKIVIDLQPYSITIYNDGPQISDDQLKKLFKPFEKGDKGKFGLGLSICHKVCNTYGYRIEAENMPNGVIFIISRKEIPEEKEEKKERKTILTGKKKDNQ